MMSEDINLPAVKSIPPDYIDIELIELESGHVLSLKQTQAVVLYVVEGWAVQDIADAVGYTAASTVYQVLNRSTGREAILLATRRYLTDAAVLGLRTMVKLAQSAKSENVRQMAAADLMDRAGLREANGGSGGGQQIQVNIDLSGKG
jgi:hypothetical protein